MGKSKYDFSGYVARYGVRCSDGTTLMPGCFSHQNGVRVPLAWNHNHDDPELIIGHCDLEARNDGLYVYGTLNNGLKAKATKETMINGDINSLSVWANHLQRNGNDIYHGDTKEVSMVLSGADPTAYVDWMSFAHSDGYVDDNDFEAMIYSGDKIVMSTGDKEDEMKDNETIAHSEEGAEASDGEETVEDVLNTLTDKQRNVVNAIVGMALESGGADDEDDEEEEESEVKHNAFESKANHNAFENENGNDQMDVISHSDMENYVEQAKKSRMSLRDVLADAGIDDLQIVGNGGSIAHADTNTNYGVRPIDWLFPNETELNRTPEFIKRDTGWVGTFMGSVHHTPFSRVKTTFANITEDEARARGYIKGKQKKDEVFTLLKRSTTPQTIYKRQKMDRDDILDVEIDIVPWIKGEMRMMLDEEIARAALVGDGRLSSDDDHIKEDNIRPIWKDADLYTIKSYMEVKAGATDDEIAKKFIRLAIKSRKDYKGSGNPTLFTTEDMLTNLLLLEDVNGRIIYDSEAKLATTLRVSKIVTVPVMENLSRDDNGVTKDLMGIIVNPQDYNIGADKGGGVATFQDFDINFNQEIYLMETRCSGALIKPYSAIVLEKTTTAA